MSDAFTWPQGKKFAISLSFDDARVSQATIGFDLLAELDLRATFFALPVGVSDHLDAWKQAVAAGHEIGNHTVSHPCTGNFAFGRDNALEDYTLAQIEEEMLRANAELEALLGVRPECFAYPCGNTFVGRGVDTASYVPLVAKHFLAGRGYPNERHSAPVYGDLAQLQGFSFDALEFDDILPLIEGARKDNGWLVLAGHEIDSKPGAQTVKPETLRAICRYTQQEASEVWVDTVGTIARHVQAWKQS